MCFVSLKLWLLYVHQNRSSPYDFSVLVFQKKNIRNFSPVLLFITAEDQGLDSSSRCLAGWFSLLWWLIMWSCAPFWSCNGCLLGFGSPRGVMFLLLALCCQASWCVFHGKANGPGFCCVLCVLVVFFCFLISLQIALLQLFLVTWLQGHWTGHILPSSYPSEIRSLPNNCTFVCACVCGAS